MSESTKKSPPNGWDSQEYHDKVRADLTAGIRRAGDPNWDYGRVPLRIGATNGICDCCGSRGLITPEFVKSEIRIAHTRIDRNAVLPDLRGREHFIIRDNDENDLLLTWSDS